MPTPKPGLLLDSSLDRRIEAEAHDAFRELWDRVVERGDAGGSRLVTPTMVKDAIEARLRDYLPKGTLLPIVDVRINAARTGFDIALKPAEVRMTLTQVGKKF